MAASKTREMNGPVETDGRKEAETSLNGKKEERSWNAWQFFAAISGLRQNAGECWLGLIYFKNI